MNNPTQDGNLDDSGLFVLAEGVFLLGALAIGTGGFGDPFAMFMTLFCLAASWLMERFRQADKHTERSNRAFRDFMHKAQGRTGSFD